MKTRLAAASVFVTAILSACVTVNVNFPESTVQKETDSYVRELYRSKSGTKPSVETSPSGTPHGALDAPAWSGLITEAYADENFKIDSAKSREILERMKGRVAEIIELKRQGTLGETTEATLTLRGRIAKPILAKKIEKLVAEENKDREHLYQEIVDSNGSDKVQPQVVRKSFTRSFQAESPSGTWVEGVDATWSQKP